MKYLKYFTHPGSKTIKLLIGSIQKPKNVAEIVSNLSTHLDSGPGETS